MSKETILVVEDESITALDIQQSLRRKGYNVPEIAGSGEEALTLARQTPPDLVLMDIRLKGDIDGIEAARRLRQEFNTPVVFLTAYADALTLERAKSAEPFAYLLKPFEEAVLSTTIDIALHKHRAHELVLQQTLEALRLSDERFERLAQSLSDYAVVILDTAGLIRSWNSGAEQLYGWAAGEAMGKELALLYSANEVAQGKPRRDLQTAERLGRLAEYVAQARKDQKLFSARTVLIALRNSGGNLAGFLKVTRPVTAGGNHN